MVPLPGVDWMTEPTQLFCLIALEMVWKVLFYFGISPVSYGTDSGRYPLTCIGKSVFLKQLPFCRNFMSLENCLTLSICRKISRKSTALLFPAEF